MTVSTTVAPARRASPDWGRVAIVPLSTVGGGVAVFHLFRVVAEGSVTSVALVTSALTAAFYALIVWAYLRRGPARATTTSLPARVAAPSATLLPFALPFLAGGAAAPPTLLVANVLLVTGLAWSVWSVRCLDRNLSVVAQARDVVESGPYAWVRHPLYLGELVAMLGTALALGGPWPLAAWAALVGLQAYRAVHEEGLLVATLPSYRGYQQRTARIVPGVF